MVARLAIIIAVKLRWIRNPDTQITSSNTSEGGFHTVNPWGRRGQLDSNLLCRLQKLARDNG